jgi:hypothetical protein
MTREFIKGSVEYLDIAVTADAELTGTVEFSTDRGTTWETAGWIGSVGVSRTARLLLDTGDYEEDTYPVWVRLSDTPEVPIVDAGALTVK